MSRPQGPPATINPPILSRTLLYRRLRNGSIQLLDFNIVNTTLGSMVEPRTLIRAGGASPIMNEDPYESAYTDIREVNEDELYTVLNFSGSQWPRVYNTL